MRAMAALSSTSSTAVWMPRHAGVGREQRGVHVGGPDAGTFGSHGERGGLPNALACGRDEHGFTFEFHRSSWSYYEGIGWPVHAHRVSPDVERGEWDDYELVRPLSQLRLTLSRPHHWRSLNFHPALRSFTQEHP